MIRQRLRYWLDRARREEMLRAEIDQHIEEVAAELRAEGRPPEAARDEAIRRFGRIAAVQEDSREIWITRLLSDLNWDIHYALRNIARNPSFAAVTVLSAALGIGACTTVFGIVNFALLRPLPVADPPSLVSISGMHLDDGRIGESMSWGEVLDIRKYSRSLASVAAFAPFLPAGITAGGETRRHWGQLVSGNYFEVTKPAFVAGGGFVDGQDDVPGAPGKIVLSHALWQSRFNTDRGIVGRTVHVNQLPLTVAGVLAPGFRGTESIIAADFFLPFSQVAAMESMNRGADRLRGYDSQWLYAVARLRPEFNVVQATTELRLLARDIRTRAQGHSADRSLYIEEAGQANPAMRKVGLPAFLLLLTVTFLVLITACANVANLMLARASARRQEISTRLALGAGRGRLVRQLMTESLLLACAGGAAGVALSEWAARHIGSFRFPLPAPIDLLMHTDHRVALFAVALAMITGVAFGLVPAIRATRADLSADMKLDRRFGLRNALVVAQVAISAALVICSGLFLRSLGAAQGIDIGMDARNVLLVRFDPALARYDDDRSSRLIQDVLREAEAIPTVLSATVANTVPLSFGGNFSRVAPEGQNPRSGGGVRTAVMAIAPRYFVTLGIRIVDGMDFRSDSREDSVVIVNQTLASKLYPGQNVVGRTIVAGSGKLRILGVVANSKYQTIQEQDVMPILYRPILGAVSRAGSFGGLAMLVKTSGDPESLTAPIRRLLTTRDPQLVVNDAGTMESHVTQSLFVPRLAASLSGLCGGMGLLIASIGIYGVISFTVARRSREIGIRMALGALPAQVVCGVLGQGVILSVTGIVLGLAGGLVLARAGRALLVGISASDPVTFFAVPVMLLIVAVLASALPARRAASIDPNRVLRTD